MSTDDIDIVIDLSKCALSEYAITVVPASKSGPSWQVAAGYRDINTSKRVVGTLQKWPAKAGGHSPKGPAVAGTTVKAKAQFLRRSNCPV